MNYKEIALKYNKLIYLYNFDKFIWNYKYNVLDEKIKLVFKRKLPLYIYYDIYEKEYINLIKIYNYYNKIL